MTKKHRSGRGLPQGKLKEYLELVRDKEMENPSLHMKLQQEMAKPLNQQIRQEASDKKRIGRLKAPAGLSQVAFFK